MLRPASLDVRSGTDLLDTIQHLQSQAVKSAGGEAKPSLDGEDCRCQLSFFIHLKFVFFPKSDDSLVIMTSPKSCKIRFSDDKIAKM